MKPIPASACAVLVVAAMAAMSLRPASAGLDGSIDTTFNAPKSYRLLAATTHHVDGVPAVVDVLSQPDGKVVVVGNAALPFETQHGTRYSNSIVATRLLPGGGVDTSFGTNGVATIPSPYQGDEYYQATAATIDSNGRIAIAGLHQENFYPRQSMAIWVLTQEGELDGSFAPNGMYTMRRYREWSEDQAMDILAFDPREWQAGLDDGIRFAMAGSFVDRDALGNVTMKQGAVVFISDGPKGWAVVPQSWPSGCRNNPLNALAARPSAGGSRLYLYAAGTMECDSGSRWAYAMSMHTYPGGVAYDKGFGYLGVSYFSYTTDFADSLGESVAIDALGRPVVAGATSFDGGWNRFGVTRLTVTGAFDTGFDSDGMLDVRFDNSPETTPSRVNVTDVLIQRDGRIIVGGDVEQRYLPGVFFTMRINGDGSCDDDWHARFTLSYMSGTPPVRTWVDCAGWYYSPAEDYVQSDEISASAMAFTEGERLLLAGSIPKRGLGASGDWALVQRYDNDGIFADGFGW